MKKIVISLLGSAVSIGLVQGATIIDNFESNSFSGGTGWSGNWGGSTQRFTADNIDGNFAAGLFTDGAGQQLIARNFSSITVGTVTASWSVRGTGGFADYNRIGFNLKGLMSGGSTNIITLKFEDAFSTLRMNDGNVDFGAGTVGYTDGAIYDFTFTSSIGSNQYSWTVAQRGGGSSSGTNFNYSFGRTLTNVSGVEFYWDANGGAGNDGFIDNISVVPEPTAALLGSLGMLGLLRRRR